jgi:glutamyl-tRNA synthetase
MTDYFFGDDYSVEEKGVEKHLKAPESKAILRDFIARLENIGDFSHTATEEACRTLAEEKKLKAGQIIHPARVAISGKTTGAGLFEMMEVLGKEKVIERLRKAAA